MRWKTAALLLLVPSAMALAAPQVETTGPCTDTAVADAVKKALAPQGYRVTLDDGSTVDFWPPAQIQTTAKTREDATYPLAPSLFFGVIHFAKKARDTRGRSEEHTSELQSHLNLVCRLVLEKKKQSRQRLHVSKRSGSDPLSLPRPALGGFGSLLFFCFLM